jgi:hypothetical protein
MFLQSFQTYVSSVSSVFFCILQLLYMNVSKVDQMLHMGCMWEAAGGAGPLLDARSQARRTRVLARSLNGYRPILASWIECLDASKSVFLVLVCTLLPTNKPYLLPQLHQSWTSIRTSFSAYLLLHVHSFPFLSLHARIQVGVPCCTMLLWLHLYTTKNPKALETTDKLGMKACLGRTTIVDLL